MGAMRAMVLWASFGVLFSEALSLFSMVNFAALLSGWLAWTVAGAVLFFRRGEGERWRAALSRARTELVDHWMILGAAVVIVLITGAVAWIAPPNTWDSLNHRLPQVAHWTQMGAVRHFASGIEIQNSMTPGAEILVLQFYVLGSGDQWVNFVGWLAILFSAIGVTKIAALLGADRYGQMAAGLFFLTLPMAIIQASSTTTDSVVGLWLICVALEALQMVRKSKATLMNGVFIGAAAGLAALTKPTAFAYLLPIALTLPIILWRIVGTKALASTSLAAVAAVLVLNGGYWSRNLSTYGHPIAPQTRISEHRTELLNGAALLSNVLRNAALHAGTPSPHINKALTLGIRWVHDLIGLDVNDPRTTSGGYFKVPPPATNEEKSGNPLHAYILAAFCVLLLIRTKRTSKLVTVYLLVALSTFLAFSALFKWQIYGSRYHLPFFALLSPFGGYALGNWFSRRWSSVCLAAMTVLSVPWLISIKSRPLIPLLGETYIASILTLPRSDLYFSSGAHLRRPYQEMTHQIRMSQCRSIGLRLSGIQAEYPLWALLGAPDPDLRIEWIVSGTPSQKYRDSSFQPCAVICENCKEDTSYGHLARVYERSGFRLFMEESP